MVFDWKDISTIDQYLGGSLQSVNSSLASFFAQALIITVPVTLSRWCDHTFKQESLLTSESDSISSFPGTRPFHWLCLSGVGGWISEYRTWFTKNGIQYKISHFLRLWRNTRGNSHCQSILCWKKVSQQCFRQDWYNYQGRILFTIFEQSLIFGLIQMWYSFWMTNRWLLLNFDALGALSVLITSLFSISTLTNEAGLAGLCITSAMGFTMSGKC